MRLQAERGSITLDTVHQALGASSVRVRQFIVRPADDEPELDDIHVGLSRSSANEFEGICLKLQGMAGVRGIERKRPR